MPDFDALSFRFMNGKMVRTQVGSSLLSFVESQNLYWNAREQVVSLDAVAKRLHEKLKKPSVEPQVAIVNFRLIDSRRIRTGIGEHAHKFIQEHQCWWDENEREVDFDKVILEMDRELTEAIENLTGRTEAEPEPADSAP